MRHAVRRVGRERRSGESRRLCAKASYYTAIIQHVFYMIKGNSFHPFLRFSSAASSFAIASLKSEQYDSTILYIIEDLPSNLSFHDVTY